MIARRGEREFRSAILVQERRRGFRVHLPALNEDGLPLVIAFHGTGTNGDRMASFCGLHEYAQERRFVVVYPDGTGRSANALSWNIGHPSSHATRRGIDDERFVCELIDWLRQHLSIDESRVYLTGISSGAMLCYRLAQRIAPRIAAIGPVAGTMLEQRRPEHPVPVMHLHGTADSFVPYQGGFGPRSLTRIEFPSVRDSINWWVSINQCHTTCETQTLPTLIDDGTRVLRESHADASGRELVVLLTIEGGGHTWPGHVWPEQPAATSILGATTANVSANAVLWRFFQQFRRQRL